MVRSCESRGASCFYEKRCHSEANGRRISFLKRGEILRFAQDDSVPKKASISQDKIKQHTRLGVLFYLAEKEGFFLPRRTLVRRRNLPDLVEGSNPSQNRKNALRLQCVFLAEKEGFDPFAVPVSACGFSPWQSPTAAAPFASLFLPQAALGNVPLATSLGFYLFS